MSERSTPRITGNDYYFYLAGRPVAQLEIREVTAPGEPPATQSRLAYLTTDHLGTPVLATDTAGATIWAGGFEPFGGDWAGARDASLPLALPGQWSDETWRQLDAELHYNVNRWYDSETGRYTRPDPLGSFPAPRQSDAFPYLYADANPVSFADPLGLYTSYGSPSFKRKVDNAMKTIRKGIDRQKKKKKNKGVSCCETYFSDRGLNLDKMTQPGGAPHIREATAGMLKGLKKKNACGTAQTSNPWIWLFVNPECYRKPDPCGFASNILHEMGHLARKDTTDNEPNDYFKACNLGCAAAGNYR